MRRVRRLFEHTQNCGVQEVAPRRKSHQEWRGGKTPANINVHQGETVNQLMAQQAEFNKSIMKQMSKLAEKKKKKKRSRQRYSDSESDDSD